MAAAQIEIYPNRTQLVQRSLALVVARIQTAITERGRCTLALAGGSTPQPLYEALAHQNLPWDQLYIFWGDERYVPIDHPESNAGMAKAAWLDHVPIPTEHIYPVPTADRDPHQAAIAYEQTLQTVVGHDPMPQLDLVLLGMGDDGHTASLFPHTPALTVGDRAVTVGKKSGEPRITLTVPTLNASRCVLFLVAGSSKQAALTAVFAAHGDDRAYPSRLIRPQGELWWLLDAAAGVPLVGRPGVTSF